MQSAWNRRSSHLPSAGPLCPIQHNEMLWHFFALTMALEQVAVSQAAERKRVEAQSAPPNQSRPTGTPEPEPEFAWG